MPTQHGKKYRAAAKNREIGTAYQATQAMEIIKTNAFAKFDETVEAVVRLGVDPRHADQVVRGTVVLPEGTGSTVRVLVIAVGDKAREAEAAGADYVGAEYLQKIKDGWLRSTPHAQRRPDGPARPAGSRAGPPRTDAEPQGGNVTFTWRGVKETKAGKIEFRVDKGGNVHVPLGKVSFAVEGAREHFTAFMDQISARSRVRPRASTSAMSRCPVTMGPALPSTPLPTGNVAMKRTDKEQLVVELKEKMLGAQALYYTTSRD